MNVNNDFFKWTQFPKLVWNDFIRRKGSVTLLAVLILLLIPVGLWLFKNNGHCQNVLRRIFDVDHLENIIQNEWYQLLLLTAFLTLAISICVTLTNIYSLKKKEAAITLCQILILVFVGFWFFGLFSIFKLQDDTTAKAYLGGASALLAWIFQDTIKGVVAFVHLRLNNLLRIGDWIQVPGLKVDGTVKRVTLTMVTIYNWDTTTSSIPTGELYSNHFINLKSMMDGKTYGRKMCMNFVLDTGWFHIMKQEDVEKLKQSGDVLQYLPEERIKEKATNAQLFRLYLYYWLMNHPHVSQLPRLIVRWMEQKESGMPLQVYAFITDSALAAFAWQQSQIVEHIVKSMEWFGLRLYQSPSNYDVSNSNVFLTDKPAAYRMED